MPTGPSPTLPITFNVTRIIEGNYVCFTLDIPVANLNQLNTPVVQVIDDAGSVVSLEKVEDTYCFCKPSGPVTIKATVSYLALDATLYGERVIE